VPSRVSLSSPQAIPSNPPRAVLPSPLLSLPISPTIPAASAPTVRLFELPPWLHRTLEWAFTHFTFLPLPTWAPSTLDSLRAEARCLAPPSLFALEHGLPSFDFPARVWFNSVLPTLTTVGIIRPLPHHDTPTDRQHSSSQAALCRCLGRAADGHGGACTGCAPESLNSCAAGTEADELVDELLGLEEAAMTQSLEARWVNSPPHGDQVASEQELVHAGRNCSHSGSPISLAPTQHLRECPSKKDKEPSAEFDVPAVVLGCKEAAASPPLAWPTREAITTAVAELGPTDSGRHSFCAVHPLIGSGGVRLSGNFGEGLQVV